MPFVRQFLLERERILLLSIEVYLISLDIYLYRLFITSCCGSSAICVKCSVRKVGSS